MRQTLAILLFATAAVLVLDNAAAQDNAQPDPRQMTVEEREAAREARRQQWENMSEEERQAAREERRAQSADRRAAMR